MSGENWYRSEVEKHRAEIVDYFLENEYHAECSCGWIAESRAGSRHDALADHAAHVHVALGLAVPTSLDTAEGSPS